MKEVAIKSNDLLYLSLALFEVENPKAIIQMIHGAKEHKERYYEFIRWLNSNGFTVVIADNRGHGKSINDNYPLGYMENFNELVEDQKKITDFIKEKYPQKDIYMFGHSFGTMIARLYLQKYDMEIKKLVLSGPPNYNDNVGMGIMVGKMTIKLKGKGGFSDTLHDFAGFNTDDWVCSNPSIMENYRNDPLCNYRYRNQALMTIFTANKEMHNIKSFQRNNKDLAILCVSGALDPVTGGAKGLTDTINTLQKIGYTTIENIVYPNMKHEILNEYDKERVYVDIIKFYLK